MALSEVPSLVDFEEVKNQLETERKTLVKINSFSDDEEYIRSVDDAAIILDVIKGIQQSLYTFFLEYPSLLPMFSKDYIPFYDFVQRANILDLIFLDDCLFPELERYYFGQDGGLSLNIMSLHHKAILEWIDKKKLAHEKAQKTIELEFDLNLKMADLSCQCMDCVATFRARMRDFVFNKCTADIDEAKEQIEEKLNGTIDQVSDVYNTLQKTLDKTLYKVRTKLKRSSLNRLESQIKNKLHEKYNYPSDIAKDHARNIIPMLRNWLSDNEFSEDLLTENEYHKFFSQLSSDFWKGTKSLQRDFRKFVRAIVVLKKKDVSSKILNDYLGEFWVHSSSREIKRKIIYHMGPTNSGKTYHAIEALSKAKTGCYLAPLRLLAGELYDTLNSKGVTTTLLTGEEVIEKEGSTHFSSTIEMARFQQVFDCCVIDEIQMITDKQRGWAWTRALVNMYSPEIHVCGDASAYELVKNVADLCGDELIVKNYERMTTLNVEKRPIVVGQLEKNDALIVFSRRNALRYKRDLEKVGFKVSIVYGRLSPEVRREQARKFDEGETDIIVSTDAISMGMNLPVRRIVFSTLSKYIDGHEFIISHSEIKQIAGRAGRFKRFPTGFVTTLSKVEGGLQEITEALNATLDQSTKCMVGPDLDIYNQVNDALTKNNLPGLKLSEFLRLFHTMDFKAPFFCVELKEMIELAEMVEDTDSENILTTSEIFGFACAPVNQGLQEHVQYYMWILSHYVKSQPIINEPIDPKSADIDYLETSIKCVELYQWLARHFDNKNFSFNENDLLENKSLAVDQLNDLLSAKIVPTCSSCGCKLPEKHKFAICEDCFHQRRFSNRGGGRRGPKRGTSPAEAFKKGLSKKAGKKSTSAREAFSKKRTKKRKFTGKK
ncbi:helicase-related protein [Halobacteriovorax sp. HLS]|uniref:helicase-related protein n=1 Tax=Halobacteriovorax sp. HLS TaxID=2234000 RepID=UPI000FD7DC33|nr:helicase-related protein [Halobacteriovorax sp. HLS]